MNSIDTVYSKYQFLCRRFCVCFVVLKLIVIFTSLHLSNKNFSFPRTTRGRKTFVIGPKSTWIVFFFIHYEYNHIKTDYSAKMSQMHNVQRMKCLNQHVSKIIPIEWNTWWWKPINKKNFVKVKTFSGRALSAENYVLLCFYS